WGRNPKFLHPTAKGIGMHAEDPRRALFTFHDPAGIFQDVENVKALDILQPPGTRSRRVVRFDDRALAARWTRRWNLENGALEFENRSLREDGRPLDDVLELADVARPGVVDHAFHAAGVEPLNRLAG